MARKSPNGGASASGRSRTRATSVEARAGGQAKSGQVRTKRQKKQKQKKRDQDTEQKVRAYARDLGEKERVVLAVRDELYSGSWEHMREDLEAREKGRTYVFRLASRIEEDLRTIRKLSGFERRHSVNLSQYL